MRDITLEELLEAGCHFGHQVTRHNPKSRDFVFEARDNIHIIDLAKTKEGLEAAGAFVKQIAGQSPETTMIIVGTKRQAKNVIDEALKQAAEKQIVGLFTVTTRWVGGTLTNFSEVVKNTRKLKDLEARLVSEDEREKYTKKEIGQWEKERAKLEMMYGGIKEMKGKPDMLFIIDSHLEDLAVREARATHVPTVAIVDTNADPLVIDHPIPANDDAVGSIKLITDYIVEAWIEGKMEEKNQESGMKNQGEETKENVSKEGKVSKSKKTEEEKSDTAKSQKTVKKTKSKKKSNSIILDS